VQTLGVARTHKQRNNCALLEGNQVNRKEKRAAKKARHKANEFRRAIRRVEKRFAMICELLGAEYIAEKVGSCFR
jgi:hypothetical protein